jgi:copper(I)-binding protein
VKARPARITTVASATALLAACATPEPPQTGRLVTTSFARPADSAATGGAYLTVVNADSIAVALTGATSPWATAVEVHETMNHDGMAHMMARTSVPIAPRDSLVMKPGGVHMMLIGLTRALREGDSVPVTLRFSIGDSLALRIPVRPN